MFELNLLNQTLHEIKNVDGVGRLRYVVNETNANTPTFTFTNKHTLTCKHSRIPTFAGK